MSLPLGVAGSEPADAAVGTLEYTTDTEKVRVKAASGWVDVGPGSGGPPTGAAGGDLAGTYPNPTVTQARGLKSATTTVSVSAATAPSSGQVLTATSTTAATWQTPSGSPTGAAGGDLAGTYPNPTVTQARGLKSATTTVVVSSATAPSAGQVLTATSSTAADWETPSASGVTTVAAGTGISVANPTGPTATVSTNFGTSSTTSCVGNDIRLSDSRAPNGSATGDLAGSYPSPTVAAIHETTGPTKLTIGAVADGQLLVRTGTTLVGQTGSAPTGAAGGDLAGTYPNPTVTQARGLLSATTTVSVSAATAPSAGQGLVATSGTTATWQALAIRDPFWDPPTTASADDDEFTVDTVASGAWGINVGASTPGIRDGAVDMSLSVMTAGHYRSSVVGSTLFIETRSNEGFTIHKTVAGALSSTQLWFMAYGTVADYSPNQTVVNFTLARNNAGQPDNNNRLIIQAQNSATRVNNVAVLASVTSTETGGTSDAGPLGQDGLYVRVSHGSTLSGNFYGGLWKRNGLHSANVAGALQSPQFNLATDRIVMVFSATAFTGVPYNGSSSQNRIVAIHFIRRMTTAGPWFAQS